MLQKLQPSSSNYKLSTLDTLHFFTSVWETSDTSITANCFKKAGFGSGIDEDQNPQENRFQCLGKP
jgi:hypothetical protein